MDPHPLQPLYDDEDGRTRFRGNAIVRYLLDSHPNADMNSLFMMPFSREDWEHFAQLIGYSLSGFGELSYVSDETYRAAENASEGGKSDLEARNEAMRETLDEVSEAVRDAACVLFHKHPDDLQR